MPFETYEYPPTSTTSTDSSTPETHECGAITSNYLTENPMSAPDALTVLNPSIIGQAEKAHNAVLDLVLAGTPLDEKRWISLQLTAAADGPVPADELVAQVANKAKFAPADVRAALEGLTRSDLVAGSAADLITVTEIGAGLVAELRAKAAGYIRHAYEQISTEDLIVAARVLTTITATLSADIAAR